MLLFNLIGVKMNKNYWLHRISHHAEVSHPLLKRNILSIGFSDFSTKEYIEKCTGNWDNFEERFDQEWGSRPRSRHSLWRFLSEMKKGDWVIVPGFPSWGKFSIYEIKTDNCLSAEEIDIVGLKDWNNTSIIKGESRYLLFDTDKKPRLDLGFFRQVEPIVQDVSRDNFADRALTARMKIRSTNANISDLKKNIEEAFTSIKNNEPINIHALILDKNLESTKSIIKEKLNPDKLEKLVLYYLRKVGATDTYTPSKNESGKEGDADVVATFEAIKTIIYVQVKFHDGETSPMGVGTN